MRVIVLEMVLLMVAMRESWDGEVKALRIRRRK